MNARVRDRIPIWQRLIAKYVAAGLRCTCGLSRKMRAPKKGLRMTKPIARDPIYRRRVFEAEIIELCVRWYITYQLSYRDLVAMMAERGVILAHSTILRWV